MRSRKQEKSVEELLDLEEELLESIGDEKGGTLGELIQVYQQLYRKITQDKESDYAASLDQIKKKLVSYLIRYGTYMKTQYRKDDHLAERNLISAIKYEKIIPIAYYRLGFLSYKKECYQKAIKYFQDALLFQKECKDNEYQLNQQQLFNANVYLANSALYIAEEAKTTLKELDSEDFMSKLPGYNQSSLYDLIIENQDYLTSNAFTVVSSTEVKTVSKDEIEDYLNEKNFIPNTIILSFTDRDHSILFNGREEKLSINHAEMLRYFFLHTSEGKPATKHHFARISESVDDKGNIRTEAYTQNIRRLRVKIERLGVPAPVIVNKAERYHGQTAYYYDPLIPFTIIHRSDSSFFLD